MSTPIRSTFNRRDFLRLGGTLAAVSLAAACTPQAEEETAQTSNEAQIPLVEQQPAANISAPLAVIALNRMAFGPRPGDVDAFNALGGTDGERLQAYVREQLNPENIDDSDFESRYAAAEFETLHKSLEELYADHIASNPYDSNNDSYWDWYSKPAYELVDATLLRAVYSRKQLSEVLADFWQNHFNVYF